VEDIRAAPAPLAPAGGERSVQTMIGGKPYTLRSDDNYLNAIAGEFEPDIVRLFDALVGPGDTVLDIGANIGCTSILFGDRTRRVFSFEPSPSTFQFLSQNIQAAQLDNVTLVNSGLGKTAGSFDLTFSSDNRSGGFISDKTKASVGHQVETITILNGDDVVRQQGIERVHFIKIDVEGFEQNVIEGLAATIARDRPVVALELNHWCLTVFQRSSVPDFFDFLRGVFPYLYAVERDDIRDLHDNNAAYHVMYHHVVCGFQYPNLVGAFEPVQLEKLAAAFQLPARRQPEVHLN
jgi:FkbM family methyltransferase